MRCIDVVAGIIWRQGRFVGSCRTKGSHAGYWEFPGGKIDAGETPPQALARELREELDIEMNGAVLWRVVEHVYPGKCIRLHVFHVTDFSGEPRSVEGQPVKWLSAPEASALPFLEADIPFVRELCEPACAPVAARVSAESGRVVPQAENAWAEPLFEPSPA